MRCHCYLIVLLSILLVIVSIQLVGTPLSDAQINYTVKVVTKDNSHPLLGQGSSVGYTINGVQGVELKMVRGIQYNFFSRSDSKSSHNWENTPFLEAL